MATCDEITSAAELRELLGYPSGRSVTKERNRLHALDREWLAISPFCVIATADADGACDASPKGDPAGNLIHVLDDTTIAIAERPGNRRADGYLNILANPHIGIISLIPGRNETLRINGRARLLRDAPFFDDLTVKGHRPILVLLVEIETIFFHCPKAFLRSQLWQPDSWQPEALPSHASMVKCVQDTTETLEELEQHYSAENYERLLYAAPANRVDGPPTRLEPREWAILAVTATPRSRPWFRSRVHRPARRLKTRRLETRPRQVRPRWLTRSARARPW